jgi:hypothetical protein
MLEPHWAEESMKLYDKSEVKWSWKSLPNKKHWEKEAQRDEGGSLWTRNVLKYEIPEMKTLFFQISWFLTNVLCRWIVFTTKEKSDFSKVFLVFPWWIWPNVVVYNLAVQWIFFLLKMYLFNRLPGRSLKGIRCYLAL